MAAWFYAKFNDINAPDALMHHLQQAPEEKLQSAC